MRKGIIFLLLAIFISVMTACANSAYSPSEMYNAPNADEIHIGIAYPVELHDENTYFAEGIELAVNTINANGGILGKTLNTVVRDDRKDAHVAMQIAETFHAQGITAVVGHWHTNICYFVEDIYEKNKVVMLTPDASGTNLFEYNYKYVYRMFPNNHIFAEAIAEHMKSAGLKRIAIYYDDDEYGNDFSSLLEKEMAKRGIVVIDRVTGITPSSVNSVMERWNAFGCDGMALASDPEDIMELVSLIHGANSKLPIFGADNIDRVEFIDALDDYPSPVYMSSYRMGALDADFLDNFRSTYGHNPDIHSISGYESVYMLRDAMEATGSVDGTAIAEYLTQLKDYNTISSTYTYNPEIFEFEGFNVSVRSLAP